MVSRSADKIRESIEQRIVEGEFKDGERLDEVRLAALFGVSRTPLREALRMLAGSGLVELIPSRGAFVRHPGIVELVEMFEVMAELEALCGRLAARRISSGELAKLSVAARACEQALEDKDPDAYYHRNEEFHQLIYKAGGNTFLVAEAIRLQAAPAFPPDAIAGPGPASTVDDRARRHFEGLGRWDAVAAADALRGHVTVQGERFHDLLASYEKAST